MFDRSYQHCIDIQRASNVFLASGVAVFRIGSHIFGSVTHVAPVDNFFGGGKGRGDTFMKFFIKFIKYQI